MPITLDGTNGITTPMYNGSITANAVTPSVNMKNRIINGAMMIDQRNAGASMTSATNGSYSLDRWGVQNNSGASRFTLQQDAGAVTPPAGFSDYLGITSTSAYSVASGDACGIYQNIEGFNSIADLNWGTANAKTVTLSFWVRSSLTGTFGGSLTNSAGNRSYVFSYTISAANTWEQKSITIAGDTSGTWLATNGTGIALAIGIGTGTTYSGTAGSWSGTYLLNVTGNTSVIGTNGATFYITGVQLEVGSTATSFDYRPYGTELGLCQRYYEKFDLPNTAMFAGRTLDSNRADTSIPLKVTKRATPSLVMGTVSGYTIYPPYQSSSIALNGTQTYSIIFESTDSAGIRTTGGGTLSSIYPITTQIFAVFAFSAEL
jgi:hypothetical protein